MTEDNTKFTNIQIIIGVVILVIILVVAFLESPATEQSQNLQEQNKIDQEVVEQEVEQKLENYFTDTSAWKEFNSPAGKFKIIFPTYPTHTADNINIPGTRLAIKFDRYSSEGSDALYTVSTSVYPPEIETPKPETSLEASLNSMLASNDRFKLISSNLTYHSGHRVLDYLITNNEGGYFRGEIIAVGPIIYQVMSGYENTNYNESNYNKFINSFAFLTSEDKIRAQIKKYFSQESLSPKIIEIKVEDGTNGKVVLVKYSRHKNSTYLFDDAEGIYKAIFTYGEKVQKAVIEQYFLSFEDKYGNRCELLAWSSKIDNPTTITKVNWEKISESAIQPWWEETHIFDLDAVCK